MAKTKAITLRKLAAVTGISFKTIQKAFAQHGAPSRTRPIEELVEWLKASSPGTVKLPADLADRMILLKWETAQERAKKEKEAAEKLRLHNLERKAQLVERKQVQADGAAIGMMLSSTLSGWVKDMPSELVGKSELEIGRVMQGKVDSLICQIRAKLK